MSARNNSPTAGIAERCSNPILGRARVSVLAAEIHGSWRTPRSLSRPDGMSRASIGTPAVLAASMSPEIGDRGAPVRL